MSDPRYVVGIDLGTTNCVVAYLDTEIPDQSLTEIPVFPIAQVVAPAEVAERPKLPSFLYLPADNELARGSLSLPWDAKCDFAVGEFARRRGAQVPGRLVASAKSWLCHADVDRTAAILPWGASEEVERLSPVTASARYLLHIQEAWNHRFAAKDDGLRLECQQVVLTVPASFDEVARELTVEAAREAGLERLTLVEEPQAAFYSWLFLHRETWEAEVQPDQLILICDVGGGTSDFSLVRVEGGEQELGFRRIAVGDHLLLGGDNMDLALAAELEPLLTEEGRRLDTAQWFGLQHACRTAKEALLELDGPESAMVAVPGRGSRLVGGTLRHTLKREQVLRCILDGFFPLTTVGQGPQPVPRSVLQEYGLPYAADPAVSRHLGTFLRDPAGDDGPEFRQPDLILFNGGVFKSARLRARTLDLLASWFPQAGPPKVLETDDEALDLAVAQGAAYYGLVRRGRGIRIAGGTARSFYVGLAAESADAKAAPPEMKALCIAPQGLNEGDEVEVTDREFELLIRHPVSFPFYSSRTRPLDRAGDIIDIDDSAMLALPPVQTVLRSGRRSRAEHVRVRLHAIMTEVGTLEIWCVDVAGDRRWRLQFEVRREATREDGSGQTDGAVSAEQVLPPELLADARARIRGTFLQDPDAMSEELLPERLMKDLEARLRKGRRSWPPGALRDLWEAASEVIERRGLSPSFEARWLNLVGYLLRPGYGYPMDEWRVKQVWRIFDHGMANAKDVQVRSEWWVLWRRVAGGLDGGQQAELLRRISPELKGGSAKARSRTRRASQEEVEMWRAAASLERIPARSKKTLGQKLLSAAARRKPIDFELWALGRLGARVPFYGSIDTVVSRETAEEWIQRLLKHAEPGVRDICFTIAMLARRCGDRARDIDEDLRGEVVQMLRGGKDNEHLVRLVEERTSLSEDEQAMVFGESLPPALRLV